MDEKNIEKLVHLMYENNVKKESFIDTIKRGSKCLKVMEEKTKKRKLN